MLGATVLLPPFTKNRQRFADAYRRHLKAAVEKHPQDYTWPIDQVDLVADRMLHAIARGSANKDGVAFRATCKELGIKYTYKAINKFWNDENWDD